MQLAGRKINRIKNAAEGALRLRTFHCNLASVVTLRYFQLAWYVTVAIRLDPRESDRRISQNLQSYLYNNILHTIVNSWRRRVIRFM